MAGESPSSYRHLPIDVKPINYRLELKPDLINCTFTGNVCIEVNVINATNKIILNSLDLNILKCWFGQGDTTISLSSDPSFDTNKQIVTLCFADYLPAGLGSITIEFSGILNDLLKGFYRSKCEGSHGKESRYIAVTQFEPIDARRAFPCWDDPAAKATFDITLDVPKDDVALSNMPVKAEHSYDDRRVLTFHRTPIMSTYLVAFIVGDFEFISRNDSNGVEIRVYTQPGRSEQGEFALNAACQFLPFYADYFGSKYPLSKLDLIAIPDFACGAMENWGLITYREIRLLIDPLKSSIPVKSYAAYIVAHELAHQWFGNLVTMEWWSDLWLNEGFATWIGFLAGNHFYPEYSPWSMFQTDKLSLGLTLDSLANSHPIQVPINHPDEIDEIFDAITYNKGAVVIRMLNEYLGETDFKNGLQSYIKKHQYSNAITDDLWKSLDKDCGTSVKEVMDCWTTIKGYPVVTVGIDREKNQVNLKQQRFSLNQNTKDEEESTVWNIPLSIRCSNGEILKKLMKTSEFSVPIPSDVSWIKLNVDCVGFYRVMYENATDFESLLAAVRSPDSGLSVADRMNIQNDIFALAKAGRIPTSRFLELMTAYDDQDNTHVWTDLLANVGELSSVLKFCGDSALIQSFNKFKLTVLSKIYSKVGFTATEGESLETAMLRADVISVLGGCGHPDVVEKAKVAFIQHCKKEASIDVGLQSAIMRTAVKHGGKKEIDDCISLYKEVESAEEKIRALLSVGAADDLDLFADVLSYMLSPDVRNQDVPSGLAGCSKGSERHQDALSRFVMDRWDDIFSRFGQGFLMGGIIKVAFGSFSSNEKCLTLKNFFKSHPTPVVQRVVNQVIESIGIRSRWLSGNVDDIKRYLSEIRY